MSSSSNGDTNYGGTGKMNGVAMMESDLKWYRRMVPRGNGTAPIIVVQGAQWGSEAKGMVAAALCEQRGINYAVRTGSVNAGHTVYYKGKAYKMQQLPTGWVNPGTKLVIGAGAYVNPDIMEREIREIAEATGRTVEEVKGRIIVDSRAGLHVEAHTARSKESGRHHLMGATGKGCSEAVVDKIKNRGKGGKLFKDWVKESGRLRDVRTGDTEELINNAHDRGERILIEGTQGQMLDLHLGPYPYVTHKQTGPANWISEVGLSPNLEYEIVLVARTFPIRVAGNSGPMPGETTWEEVAEGINNRLKSQGMEPRVTQEAIDAWRTECGRVAASYTGLPGGNYEFHKWPEEMRLEYRVAVSEFHRMVMERLPEGVKEELKKVFEFTTVTNKLRRVASMDLDILKTSIRQTRPSYLVLTFLNYLFPELWEKERINSVAKDYVWEIEDKIGVKIRYVSTGPESKHLIQVSW